MNKQMKLKKTTPQAMAMTPINTETMSIIVSTTFFIISSFSDIPLYPIALIASILAT